MVDMMMQAGVNPWDEVERQTRRAYAAEQERDELKAKLEALTLVEAPVDLKPTIGDRDFMKEFIAGRHPSTASLMLHFAWSHYCGEHEDCARQIANLAIGMMHALPDSPELSAGLRKLLEARDCFDRAYVDMDDAHE